MFKELNILLSGSRKGWNSQPIEDEKHLLNLLNTEYSSAWNIYLETHKVLKRGDEELSTKLPLLIIPEKRYSQNTENFYTTLFSEILPSWDGWPKRNHCVVCTTNINKATSYGSASFYIFPKNNTDIAMCPTSDIWGSFENIGSSGWNIADHLKEFNRFFREIIQMMDIYIPNKNYETKTGILTILKTLKKIFKEYPHFIEEHQNYRSARLLNFLYDNKSNMIGGLNGIFDPYYNSFIKTPIETFGDYFKPNVECWFDGPSIFISVTNAEILRNDSL